MKTWFILMICLAFASLPAFPQWSWRNPLPQGNRLQAAWFTSPSTGWAVGDVGTIIKTSDGGQSWSVKNLTEIHKLVLFAGVSFPDPATGYAMDEWGLVYKTKNGGDTWDSVYYENDEYLLGIFFTDELHGCMVGSGGKIIRTSNGGDAWQFQYYPSQDDLNSVWFANQDTGYIAGRNGLIIKTVDGGNSWGSMHSDSAQWLRSIHFITPARGCAVGWGGVILNTSDGGTTWTEINLGDTVRLNSVSMFNNDTMLAAGYAFTSMGYTVPLLLRSTDGGATWPAIQSSGDNFSPQTVFCKPEGTAWCFGGLGFISRSDDFGATWIVLSTLLTVVNHWGAGIRDIDFPTGEVGYAVAGGQEMPTGTVLKTTDGGDTWSELDTSFYPHNLNVVDFPTADQGFIGGNEIYSTWDGGDSWICRYMCSGGEKVSSIDFATPVTGVAVGAGGLFLRSTDMGQSWGHVTNAPAADYWRVCFPDPDTGYVLGNKKLLKTVDAGATWSSIPFVLDLNSIYFVTPEIAYGVGYDGFAVKTTDGGTTWDILPVPTDDNLDAVHFYDKDTGFVAGGTYVISSVIFKTTDGGAHWTEQPVPSIYPIVDICVTSNYKAYACGWLGMLLGTGNGGGYTAIDSPERTGSPLNTRLFPNPASESATIRYTLAEPAQVVLKIYSLVGEELKEIVNFKQGPGTYTIPLRTQDFTEGLYIYRLTAGTNTETGKVLIKVNH